MISEAFYIEWYKNLPEEAQNIIADLHHSAGKAGLAKMMDGLCAQPSQDWHVVDVRPSFGLQEIAGWHVFIKRGSDEGNRWNTQFTYITGSEILAWQLRQAQEREYAQHAPEAR